MEERKVDKIRKSSQELPKKNKNNSLARTVKLAENEKS